MAEMSGVTECRNGALAKRQQATNRLILLVLGLPSSAAVAAHAPALGLVLLIAVVALWIGIRPDSKLMRRSEGEQLTLRALEQLPDDFYVLNQLDVPDERTVGETFEAQLLVISSNNVVFLLEVRHVEGRVLGDVTGSKWTAVGARGSYKLANPLRRAKVGERLLASLPLPPHARPWVQSVVVFSHPSTQLKISGSHSIPCLSIGELNPYLQGFHARGATAVEALETFYALKQTGAVSSSAGDTARGSWRFMLVTGLAAALAAVLAERALRAPRDQPLFGAPSAASVADAPEPSAVPHVQPDASSDTSSDLTKERSPRRPTRASTTAPAKTSRSRRSRATTPVGEAAPNELPPSAEQPSTPSPSSAADELPEWRPQAP